MRRRRALATLAATTATGTIVVIAACGDSGEASPGLGATSSSGGPLSDAGFTPRADAAYAGTASGVVILHAAAFPAFRLCFSGYPELAPQPDSTVMPEANLVGVEVGSLVRIAPLGRVPGTVYVIDQRYAKATPAEPKARKCGELIADHDFTVDRMYHVAGEIKAPIGTDRVHLLAITGCGGGSWLQELGVDSKDCPDWNETRGSLRARTLELRPQAPATTKSLPVQIIHLSPTLEAARPPGERIDVTFGSFDAGPGPLAQPVASSPLLYDASAPVTLSFEQSGSEAVYGNHGFRIALTGSGGVGDAGDGGVSFTVDQSLATVQDLSFPQTVPTTYYLTSSSYVLLLLGDPRVPRTIDGGANPDFPRRSVHLLAVPVREPPDASAPPSLDDAAPLAQDN